MRLTIKPFPNKIGDYIELPGISELIKLPVLKFMPIDMVRSLDIPIFNMLLGAAPLTHSKKGIFVYSRTQFLYEGCTATLKKFEEFDSEWHIDNAGDWFEDRDIFHLLQTESATPTEFNVTETSLEIEDHTHEYEVRRLVNAKKDELGIVGKKVDPNRFYTFDRHLHRAGVPMEDSYRFTFGIVESDFIPERPLERAIDNVSYVYVGTEKVPNIENRDGEIIVHKGVE